MKWTVVVKVVTILEVEADTVEQAQKLGQIEAQDMSPTETSVLARWAGANDEMYRLLGLWVDAGSPDFDVDGRDDVHDDTSRQAAVVREFAIRTCQWPIETEQADSVFDELLDHFDEEE